MSRHLMMLLCILLPQTLTSAAATANRMKRSPMKTMMVSGFYPEGAMSAFASGDTVATNSFIKRSQEPAPVEERTEDQDLPAPKENPQKEDDDDDDADSGQWPFLLGRNSHSINTFFPITFGGGLGRGFRDGKARQDDDFGGYPGSATAIANSFSTGRGGVANSHATSFGDPYLASMFRNRGKKALVTDE